MGPRFRGDDAEGCDSADESAFQALGINQSNRIDSLELRLMIQLGGMLAIAVAILAAIIKF